MRILIGSVIQESNTFSPVRSTLADFRSHQWLEGAAILDNPVENELQGCLRAAKEHQVEVVPTISANAISSGKFSAAAFAELKTLITEKMKQAGSVDGVYFAMHGAMVAEDCDDVEGELLHIIRRLVGDSVPIVVSLDLHANVTGNIVQSVDGLLGFRTFPHTDFSETGYRSAQLLFSIVRGEVKPHIAFRKLPVIVPAENSQTSYGPFAELWEEAAAGEQRNESLHTSLFPVQPWLDIEEMGASVVVVGLDKQKAEQEAERLAGLFWEKRHAFSVTLHSVDEVIRHTEQKVIKGSPEPVIVSDSSDSPSAGSTGDSTVLLRALLQTGAWQRLRCLLMVVDAPASQLAAEAGVGKPVSMRIGYTLNDAAPYAEVAEIKGRVRSTGDGRFTLQGGYAKNTVADMGRYAVVDVGKVSLLISEKPTFSSDPGMYRSVGLEPAEADLVMVKSANQFRQDYNKISQDIFILNTPGCSPADIRRLEYKKLVRPFYPFDDHFDWNRRERHCT